MRMYPKRQSPEQTLTDLWITNPEAAIYYKQLQEKKSQIKKLEKKIEILEEQISLMAKDAAKSYMRRLDPWV